MAPEFSHEATAGLERAPDAAENAVVFQGTDYFMIWVMLMFKRYDALARRFVDLRDPPRGHDEIVALLRRRTQRLPKYE